MFDEVRVYDAAFLLNQLPGKLLRKVRFCQHASGPWWFRLMTKIFRPLRTRWITIRRTIYYPDSHPVNFDELNSAYQMWWLNSNLEWVAHELKHIKQWDRFGVVGFLLLYFVFPLPVFFSGRWWLEREAYNVNIAHPFNRSIDWVLGRLDGYVKPWPVKYMRRWFERYWGIALR